MRTRKPAAAGPRGNACHRCTALLYAGVERCSMCGWPAGVGYPPADGEVEAAASAIENADPEPQAEADAEHSAAQLDALATMAQRQSHSAEAAEAPASAPEPEVSADANDDPVVATDTATSEAASDVDPLTAPIENIATDPDNAADAADETPIAAVAAEALATDSTAPVAVIASPADVLPHDETDAVTTDKVGRASSLARPAQLLIVAAAVLNLVIAGMQAAFGDPVDASMTTVVLGMALLTLAVWTAAAVTFLYWVSKAHTHVAVTATYRQRHGASMSLIGWLIPVVGLVIGYRVLQDLWTGSDPSTRNETAPKPVNARLIDVWLLGLVTGAVFSYVLPRVLGNSTMWDVIAAVGVAAAGLALASVISTISSWQQDGAAPADVDSYTVEPAVVAETATTRVDELGPSASPDSVTPQPAASTAD
jgi:hypothetical protein